MQKSVANHHQLISKSTKSLTSSQVKLQLRLDRCTEQSRLNIHSSPAIALPAATPEAQAH